MPKKSPITVLVAVADRALALRLQRALKAVSWCKLLSAASTAGERQRPDCIVIDSNTQLLAPQRRNIARGDTSIIAIGVDISLGLSREPQVRLPAESATAEVLTACRLASEAARLRRRVRRLKKRVQKGHRQRQRLSQLAATDPLTGLPNRRAWQRELHARLSEGGGEGTCECLAIVDLDYFKQINDTQGYAAGDRLLQSAGTYLRQALRALDFVGRLGGDEFSLLLGDVDERSAATIIDRVRTQVCEQLRSEAPQVGVSIGYVVFEPQAGLSGADLTAAADRALRQAKILGRDRAAAAPPVLGNLDGAKHSDLPRTGGHVEHLSA